MPELEVRNFKGDEWPDKRISISEAPSYPGEMTPGLFVNARYAELADSESQATEIARRCNSWPEVADNVACLLSAIEHSVDKDENYDMDMAPHIEELERLIGGEV